MSNKSPTHSARLALRTDVGLREGKGSGGPLEIVVGEVLMCGSVVRWVGKQAIADAFRIAGMYGVKLVAFHDSRYFSAPTWGCFYRRFRA